MFAYFSFVWIDFDSFGGECDIICAGAWWNFAWRIRVSIRALPLHSFRKLSTRPVRVSHFEMCHFVTLLLRSTKSNSLQRPHCVEFRNSSVIQESATLSLLLVCAKRTSHVPTNSWLLQLPLPLCSFNLWALNSHTHTHNAWKDDCQLLFRTLPASVQTKMVTINKWKMQLFRSFRIDFLKCD